MGLKIRSKGAKVKKLQTQLSLLGYKVKSDGKFGLNTLKAVRAFQSDCKIKVDGIVGKNTQAHLLAAGKNMDVNKPKTEHFNYDEFISSLDQDAVKNGVPKTYWGSIQSVMEKLEQVREKIGGQAIVIRSGYRSKAHNKAVGGAKTSQHLFGKAVDIYVKDKKISCYQLAKLIFDDMSLRCLFGGFGLGSDNNVHLDIRTKQNPKNPTIWWYRKKSWKEWGKGQ